MMVSGFANASGGAELMCTSQGGDFVNLTQGSLESLVDGNDTIHYWVYADNKVIKVENVSEMVKGQIVDSFKQGYNIEACIGSNNEIMPVSVRITSKS